MTSRKTWIAILLIKKTFLCLFISQIGCGVKIDPLELENSIFKAQNAIKSAEEIGANEFAKNELDKAKQSLNQAKISRDQQKSAECSDFAFRSEMEAKIAGSIARQRKAEKQISQIRAEDLQTLILGMEAEIQTAQTRQAIAEEKARQAERRANLAMQRASAAESQRDQAEQSAVKAKRRATAQAEIDRAETILETAKTAGALEHALTDYQKAEKSIQNAKKRLSENRFDLATQLANEAEQIAKNARTIAARKSANVQTTRSEAKAAAELAIRFAKTEIQKAIKMNAEIHVPDQIAEIEKLINQAENAIRIEKFNDATQIATQAKQKASATFDTAKIAEEKRKAQEALEEKIARSKDLIFKLEEQIGQQIDKISPIIPNAKDQLTELLNQAKLNLDAENYDGSIRSSTTAIDLISSAIAKAEGIDQLENEIIQKSKSINATEVVRTKEGVLIRFSGDLFGSGSSTLNLLEYSPKLLKLAELINAFPDLSIVIEAHSDSIGNEKENLKLTKKRVEAFAKFLIGKGKVKKDRLTTFGKGEKFAITSNINQKGRDRNRRVDTIFLTRVKK